MRELENVFLTDGTTQNFKDYVKDHGGYDDTDIREDITSVGTLAGKNHTIISADLDSSIFTLKSSTQNVVSNSGTTNIDISNLTMGEKLIWIRLALFLKIESSDYLVGYFNHYISPQMFNDMLDAADNVNALISLFYDRLHRPESALNMDVAISTDYLMDGGKLRIRIINASTSSANGYTLKIDVFEADY